MDLLVLADATGVVDMTHDAIARVTNIDLAEVVAGIDKLMKPDPASRSGAADGARLVLLDSGQRSWGWRITNFGRYRSLRNEDARRAYHRGGRRSFVYYAVEQDRVRIGLSSNPWARACKLGPSVKLVAKEAGDESLLSRRHEQFAAESVRKGWFRLSEQLQNHIAAVAATDGVIGVARVVTKVAQGSNRVAKGSNGSQRSSSLRLGKSRFGVAPGSNGVAKGSKKQGGIEAEAEGDIKVPSLSSLPRERQPAKSSSSASDDSTSPRGHAEKLARKLRDEGKDPAGFITDRLEAKRLICERILNGKDPSRPWSDDAEQKLMLLLPIPWIELERIAWFRGLPDDGTPELTARKPITPNGLMAYWADEFARAADFWQELYGWREKLRDAKKKEPPRWREFFAWKYPEARRQENSFWDLPPHLRKNYQQEFAAFQTAAENVASGGTTKT